MLVLSRDLGSALIFFLVFVFLVFFATGKYRYLALGAAGGCAAACVAYRLFSHVQVRVQAWRDPWSVIDSQGYQMTQSLFALSRGGWFGWESDRVRRRTFPMWKRTLFLRRSRRRWGFCFL